MHPGARILKGRQAWSCGPCAVLLFSFFLSSGVEAMFQGSGQRETVHRVFKVKVTEDVHVLTDVGDVQLKEKRDGNSCPASYSLCAQSLGGDCCPENYACASSSCYATTAAVSTCQGQVGHYACPLSLQGGCCPQGLLCASEGCLPPAGATYSMTCPTGYFLCPASMNYGCCSNGMGCGVSTCYSTSPSTTTTTYTTSSDGSAMTITKTSVVTPASQTADASSDGGVAVPNFFPTTEAKVEATSAASSSGGGGLSKGAIGGIVAAVAALLIAVLAATFFILKRLRHTEQAVQSHRETTSGTRTRRTNEKKSEVNVRVQPTPSEVDNLDDDPLMMNSSVPSPRRQHHLSSRLCHGRSASASDDAMSQPSVWSGPSAGMRWNTPSLTSDPDDNPRFELPPRPEDQIVGSRRGAARVVHLRHSVNSADSRSQFSYHNYAHTHGHGRQESNASELSAGSVDETGANERRGSGGGGQASPLMRQGWAAELDAGGAATPELPGSDTEIESHNPRHQNDQPSGGAPRSQFSGSVNPAINSVISPVSTTRSTAVVGGRAALANALQAARDAAAAAGSTRRRGDSLVSPLDTQGQNSQGGGVRPGGARLGSIDESATATDPLPGQNGTGYSTESDSLGYSPTVPGLVSLGPGSRGWGGGRPSQDSSERS